MYNVVVVSSSSSAKSRTKSPWSSVASLATDLFARSSSNQYRMNRTGASPGNEVAGVTATLQSYCCVTRSCCLCTC